MASIRDEIFTRFNHYLRIVLRRKYLFILAILAPLVFTLIYAAITPPGYVSTATLLPNAAGSDVGVFAMLVGAIGKTSGTTAEGLPASYLYDKILVSRTILRSVLNAEYSYYKNGKYIEDDLYSIMKFPRNNRAFAKMRDRLSIKSDFETGMITIKTTAHDPELAAQITNQMIISLDNFNKYIRVTTAKRNLKYLENRIEDAYKEYQAALDSFVEFQKSNRGYPSIGNPEVIAQAEELELRKNTKKQVYQILIEEYEMTKLTKEKTTPVVSVLDSASVPVDNEFPKKIPIFLVSLFTAFVILYFWILLLEASDPTPSGSPVTWKEIMNTFKNDFHRLGDIFRRKQ